MNAFITSQFSYSPLVWMSYSRTMNKKINKIHEKTLRPVYKDKKNSLFRWFAEKWQISKYSPKKSTNLATEIYKARNDLGSEIMKDIFHSVQKPYNLRNDSTLRRQRNRTVYFGTESISSLAPKIWEIVPCGTKNAKSLDIFFKKRQSSGQQVNFPADFAKDSLAM